MVVEAAIILPLMVCMCTGVIQFGFRLQQGLVVSNATRQAARVGAQQGANVDADEKIVAALREASGPLADKIVAIVVYKADPDGAMTIDCRAMVEQVGFDGDIDACNIYRAETGFSLEERLWKPETRSTDLEATRSDLGVWVQVGFSSPLGGLFGLGDTIVDHAVFRIEPKV